MLRPSVGGSAGDENEVIAFPGPGYEKTGFSLVEVYMKLGSISKSVISVSNKTKSLTDAV